MWKKRAFVALLAIYCTTCGHTNNVDGSGPTYTCTQCSSEHTTAGVTVQQPASPTFAPQTSADLWHDRIGHAVRDLTGVRGTRLPASTKPTCPCTTCALTSQHEKYRTHAQTEHVHERRAGAPNSVVFADLHGP